MQRSHALGAVALVVGAVAGLGLALVVVGPDAPGATDGPASDSGPADSTDAPLDGLSGDAASVEQFEDSAAYWSYVAAGQHRMTSAADTGLGRPERHVGTADVAVEGARPVQTTDDASSRPSRVAETNVQVGLLDEPDVVKTDGEHFYYAPPQRYGYYVQPEPRRDDAGRRPPEKQVDRDTHVIDASDPDAPEAIAEIDTTGKLLQTGDRLVVFERNRVAGYDVSDPENPTEEWTHPLNSSFVTAREANGTVYLVTRSAVGSEPTCPVRPMGDKAVDCSDVYRPGAQIAVDSTYTAFSLDAASGTVEDSVSFVGTADNSVVYMSPDALYVTYTQEADRAALMGTFVREEFDRTPASVDQRIAEIQSYNISTASKLREMRRALQTWMRTLPAEEREATREAFREQFDAYLQDHRRELTTTGIVRVAVDDEALSVDSTGTVPGEPLNQFSLDQHDGTLRVATTIPRTGGGASENDLYTLDARTLERQGSVTGMGDDQRVYAVRYVEETAYVVTFRQVDPLHVVDLSNPADPVERGTLELPGYSSYLHPIDDDTVLGIGEENGKVKAVLFDVSDPTDPTIADSTVFDQRYSAVSETHHAFLIDWRHGVFALPAGDQTLVVDYTGGELTTEATVEADARVTRTRYVENSLYVFAGQTVTVVDETDWSTTATLPLDGAADSAD